MVYLFDDERMKNLICKLDFDNVTTLMGIKHHKYNATYVLAYPLSKNDPNEIILATAQVSELHALNILYYDIFRTVAEDRYNERNTNAETRKCVCISEYKIICI